MKNIKVFYLKIFSFWWWNFQYIWIGVFSYIFFHMLTQHPLYQTVDVPTVDFIEKSWIADNISRRISQLYRRHIQWNLNSSNTDGSFTMANSNSVLSPYEILPMDQENKYLRMLSYFIMKLYVVSTH